MTNQILHGDSLELLKTLPENSVDCVVTSPPYYGLRDYGYDGQMGLEKTPEEYVQNMVNVFREVRRVLKSNGTLWLNIGDSYAGGGNKNDTEGKKQKTSKGATWANNDNIAMLKANLKGYKTKDLIGIPWMLAFALRADGWYLRQDIIWHKPNPMPESVTDRCTKAHEYIFLLSKSSRYYYDYDAIKEPSVTANKPNSPSIKIHDSQGRHGANSIYNAGNDVLRHEKANKRSVWTVTTKPYKGAHFATYPTDLIEPCILAGCPVGGVVLDPFFGAGTTGVVAKMNLRNYIGIELNEEYIKIAQKRINNQMERLYA